MFTYKKATKRSLSKRRLVYGVGVNDSEYITAYMQDGKLVSCPFYKKWIAMLQRCYDGNYLNRHPTYIGCSVCDDWLSFSCFKGWMKNQDWQGKDLDKDIINRGNKIYSPANCVFLDRSINTLLNINRINKGDLPVGVFKSRNGFKACCAVSGRNTYIDSFKTPELAFKAYKEFKYKLIFNAANLQDEPLKSALLNYKII
jgi:hypothetical protein